MPEPDRLRDISDTALWVAAYRAEESERPDALFRDPHARRLAGERGFRILDAMPRGRKTAWPMVARTVILDRIVRDRIASGCDLVLNLAAGLDARPYRMELPADLVWVEVDLPGMIRHKSAVLAGERPACRLERIGADLADPAARRAALVDAARLGRRALILTEGLLVYLAGDDVAALAGDLATAESFRWWATDLASPALLRMLQRSWGKQVGEAGAPFRFAPEEGWDFFAPHGWRCLETVGQFHAAGRLGRLPFPLSLIARLTSDPKRFNPKRVWGGVCLFERA